MTNQESMLWAIVLKPLVMLIFMGMVVIPIEMLLAKVLPEFRLKAVLFDRTFRDREPAKFMAAWFVLIGLLWTFIFTLI